MALSNCPECKQAISETAKSCPHCGFQPAKKSGCLSTILVAVGILVVFSFMGTCSDNGKSDAPYEYTGVDAVDYSQKKIKEFLKSPSTAQFPTYREKINHVTGSSGEFMVNSWVDSQNGFGAIVRTYYSCKVIFEDGKAKIRELKID